VSVVETVRRLQTLPFMMPTDAQIAAAYLEAVRLGTTEAAALCLSALEFSQAAMRSRRAPKKRVAS
jgi:hypothetical protein